jgi:hypothetical protein
MASAAILNHDVCGLRERRMAVAGDGNEARTQTLDRIDDADDFGLTAVRDGHNDIVALNDTEIAVNSLSRMKKVCRCSCAGKRRGNLLADDAGLPDTGHDDATAA